MSLMIGQTFGLRPAERNKTDIGGEAAIKFSFVRCQVRPLKSRTNARGRASRFLGRGGIRNGAKGLEARIFPRGWVPLHKLLKEERTQKRDRQRQVGRSSSVAGHVKKAQADAKRKIGEPTPVKSDSHFEKRSKAESTKREESHAVVVELAAKAQEITQQRVQAPQRLSISAVQPEQQLDDLLARSAQLLCSRMANNPFFDMSFPAEAVAKTLSAELEARIRSFDTFQELKGFCIEQVQKSASEVTQEQALSFLRDLAITVESYVENPASLQVLQRQCRERYSFCNPDALKSFVEKTVRDRLEAQLSTMPNRYQALPAFTRSSHEARVVVRDVRGQKVTLSLADILRRRDSFSLDKFLDLLSNEGELDEDHDAEDVREDMRGHLEDQLAKGAIRYDAEMWSCVDKAYENPITIRQLVTDYLESSVITRLRDDIYKDSGLFGTCELLSVTRRTDEEPAGSLNKHALNLDERQFLGAVNSCLTDFVKHRQPQIRMTPGIFSKLTQQALITVTQRHQDDLFFRIQGNRYVRLIQEQLHSVR